MYRRLPISLRPLWSQSLRPFVLLTTILALLALACGGTTSPVGSPENEDLVQTDPVTVTLDASRAVNEPIGEEGGTLQVTAADGTSFELMIPEGALDFEETIQMTPVSRMDGLSLSGGLIGAVTLEPEGIIFYEPATLRITPAADATAPLLLGFAYEGAGDEFHLQPFANTDELKTTTGIQTDSPLLLGSLAVVVNAASTPTLELSVPQTRGYGAGSGSAQDVTRRQKSAPRPKDPIDNLEESILIFEDGLRVPILGDRHLAEQLAQTFQNYVEPLLQAAVSDPSSVDIALHVYDRWLSYVNEFGLYQTMLDEISTAKVLLLDIMENASEAAIDRCYSQKKPEEGFRLARLLRYGRKFLPGAPQVEGIQNLLANCLTFKGTFHSIITETGSGYGYHYEINVEFLLKATRSARATGSAPYEYAASWTAGGPCAFQVDGTGSTLDMESAGFGLTFAPVSRTSPEVKVILRYDPGTPAEATTILCEGVPPVTASTTAWLTYFTEMHAYERDGSAFKASVQVQGAGTFTGWVYSHTTTGPGGQAVVEDTQIEIIHTPQK